MCNKKEEYKIIEYCLKNENDFVNFFNNDFNEKNILKKLNNCFIQYRGGGYSGCFWEWNFFIVKNKEFLNIFNSGHAGIKNINDLVKYISNRKDTMYITQIPFNKNKKIKKQFSEHIIKEVSETYHELIFFKSDNSLYHHDFYYICGICNNDIIEHENFVNSIDLGYYKGDGGIGINATKQHICLDCERENSCNNCGEFLRYGYDDQSYEKTLNDNNDEICPYCYHYID